MTAFTRDYHGRSRKRFHVMLYLDMVGRTHARFDYNTADCRSVCMMQVNPRELLRASRIARHNLRLHHWTVLS